MIFDYLMKINQKKLITKYRLEPFEIRVQTLERTLIDKVFAVKSNRIIDNYGGYLYNNFCFEDEDGFSSEIDHILITKGGVFVIETKGNKGTIYGAADDERWICFKKDYQNDKTFINPIIQDKCYINHLNKMF